ncbi:MAG: response regulator [Proteobacteria bacterium]|nr:response regulator [Pseudomonadota bacterium]MBU4258872.1 response regulator [Pseudomonadota bacterium]MBU4415216.1 response regulator [Pseudomonadota bacterium]
MSDKPNITILNVDDHDDSRYAVSEIVRHEGFGVMEAASGAEALKLVKENPDLVLLDVKLPDINGFEVCRRIKADPATSLIPVLLLSATYLDDQSRVKGLESGADGYLRQPIAPLVLIAYVKSLLRVRQAEEALAASKFYTESIIQNLLDTLVVVDAEGKIQTVNPATCDLLGYTEQELIGQPIDIIFAADTLFKGTRMKELIEEGSVREYDMTYQTKSGEKIPVCFSGSVMYETRGQKSEDRGQRTDETRDTKYERRIIGIVGIARDMREIKRLMQKEKELAAAAAAAAATEKKRAAELEKAYSELKETQAQLIQMEKLAAVGQLGAGVAHEINNPIAIITSAAQHLLKKLGDKEISKIKTADLVDAVNAFKKIAEEGGRCGRITSRILQFSSQKAPKMELVDINKAAEEILSIVAHNLSLRKIGIKKKLAHDLPKIDGDSDQLKQAFLNMILNAQHAMPNGGELKVETLYNFEDRILEIKFADTGTGIADEIRSKIFDPFFSTGKVGEGTGLGLSVSYGIIKAHNGSIDVESVMGKGTTFTIKLPLGPKGGGDERQ